MGSIRNSRRRAATAVAATLLVGVIGASSLHASEGPSSQAAMSRPLISALKRAAPKRIPGAARVLDLKQVGRKGNARSVTITTLREVHRFASLVDRLPVQTVSPPCPLPIEEAPGEIPSVQLIFRATTGGAPLAEAIQDVPVSICAPLELTIRGHGQEPRSHGQIIVRAVTRVFER